MWAFSQESPWATDPSCMSSSRLGTTTDTVGRLAKLLGNSLNTRLSALGTLEKSDHGLCLRAYSPLVHPVKPSEGMDSEYPVKVRLAPMSSDPRLAAENVCGQLSSVMPCVDPEKKAR